MKQKQHFLFKGLLYFSVAIFFSVKTFCQTIPPFKMYRSDKTIFNAAADLSKTKPLILIYFDPDCDHCQKLMNELFKKINEFKKAQIVMITYKSIEEVAGFEEKYSTHKYSNITVGTEGIGFYLRNYYQLMTMPFTALYDKKGNLNYSYRKETPVDDLVSRLKKVQ